MAQPSPRRVACGIALAAALVGRAGVAPAQDLFVVSRANGKVLRYAGGDGSFVRAVVETIDTGFRNPGGMALRPAYARFDAEHRFGPAAPAAGEGGECISGAVLTGVRKPPECPAFGTRCTPEHPLGATMVSAEGACAAYFRYRAPQPA